MKKFWIYNLLFGIILMFMLFSLLFFGIKSDNPQYFTFSKITLTISLIQLVLCISISIIKYKLQSFWTLIYILILGLLFYFEVILFFGILSGFLGDSVPMDNY